MAKHTLVLDTNVIVSSKYRFNSPTWRLVFALVRMGEVRLIVPEVVIREAVGRYRNAMRQARKDLDRLGIELESLDEHFHECETDLRSKLSAAEVPPEPSCSLLDLADRAIYRSPPFNQGGNGFRDAMVWAHVCDAVQAYGAVVFLTGDSDFLEGANQPTLKKALADETNGSVQPFKTVDEWISTIEIGDSPPDVRAAAAEKVVATNEHLTSVVASVLTSQPISVSNQGELDVVVTSVEITQPIVLLSLKVGEGVNDQHLAMFRATTKFTLEVPGTPDGPTSWTTRPVDVTGSMSYDPQSDDFGKPEFEVIEVPLPLRSWVDGLDLDAAFRAIRGANGLPQRLAANSAISAAIASFYDASQLASANRSGIQAALDSLPNLSDHLTLALNVPDDWTQRQTAISKVAVESFRKSYIESLSRLTDLWKQTEETDGSTTIGPEDKTPEPDDQGRPDQPNDR